MSACPFCGQEISAQVEFCPHCHKRTRQSKAILQPAKEISQPKTSGRGYLEFLGGPEDGRITRLSGEKSSVGRREGHDIHIFSDSALSRHHADIYYRDGQFWIKDRKSSFGTWVDGERVPIETEAMLHGDSLIQLARTRLIFHLGEPEDVVLEAMAKQGVKSKS